MVRRIPVRIRGWPAFSTQMLEAQIVGKPSRVVKEEEDLCRGFLRSPNGRSEAHESAGNPTTRNSIFSRDTTRAAAQNPRNFSVRSWPRGPDRFTVNAFCEGFAVSVFSKRFTLPG